MHTARPAKLRRLAVAWCAAALLGLVWVFTAWNVLFSEGTPARYEAWAPPDAPTTAAPPPRVVWVVVDGLNAAAVPRHMPYTWGLGQPAAGGATHEVEVEALAPSTVAGLRAMVEGRVIGPGHFIWDFAATAAPGGGVFQAVSQAGRRAFVAGPRLWEDLYAPWVSAAVTLGLTAAEDRDALAAAVAAIEQGDHHLVVLHMVRPDWAAHGHGRDSPAYAAALDWCDRAIATLHRAAQTAPPDGAPWRFIVTSDHGVTAGGGHAGPEPVVRRVPVVSHPALAGTPPTYQRHIGATVLSALGFSGPPAAPPDAHAPPPSGTSAWEWLLAGLATLGAVALWRHASDPEERPWEAFTLHAALWAVAAMGMLLSSTLGMAAGTGVLAAAGLRAATGSRTRPFAILILAAPFAAGVLQGATRAAAEPAAEPTHWPAATLWVVPAVAAAALAVMAGVRGGEGGGLTATAILARATLRQWRWWAAFVALAAVGVLVRGPAAVPVVVIGVAAGGVAGVLAASRNTFAANLGLGVLLGALVPALAWMGGETASLSSIDVRAGTRLLGLPLGLLWAIVVVAVGQALPVVAGAVGAWPQLRSTWPESFAAVAAGAAAIAAGQIAAGAWMLSNLESAGAALGLGALLRGAGEGLVLWGALAAVAVHTVGGPHQPPSPAPGGK